MHESAINLAIKESMANKSNSYQEGGPFGAVIVNDGKIIASAHNTVIKDMDPTAHAEVNVIREACKRLGTNDLSDCILYTSCEPCPMCLSATIWANIKKVYYFNTKKDAGDIGFRDDLIYEYIKGNNNLLECNHLENDMAKAVFKEFKEITNKRMY